MLAKGTILTERFIERLKELGIPSLYVEDGLLPDIEIDDVISEETRTNAVSLVRSLMGEKGQEPGAVLKKATILGKELAATVFEIVDQLLMNRNTMVNLVDIRSHDQYTFNHSVNVCVLSVLTGIAMGYSRDRLGLLAMGSLLHDVGKIRIPPEILNKPGKLSAEEYELVKMHCQFGFEIIKSSEVTDIVAASISLQHHERYDGQGYPHRLKEKKIHEFSRIVGVVDTYDAVTSDRVYRKAFPPHEAYELISGAGGHLFDYEITRAFLSYIPAYPVGTIVILNTNEVGAVVENVRGYSKFPRVRILFDPYGKYVENGKEIWLAEKTEYYVVRTVENVADVQRRTGKNR
ncbi:MAG: HD-GYP domain-containing protein [Peptococcaceae bacterium]|nr:HD-GYP domain-containing protein [Peptococcaceae bacterium]